MINNKKYSHMKQGRSVERFWNIYKVSYRLSLGLILNEILNSGMFEKLMI